LFVLHPTIGDVVGLTPLFRWARRSLPETRLFALTSRIACELLSTNPYLDDVWVRPGGALLERTSLWLKMRKHAIDVGAVSYGRNRLIQDVRYGGARRIVVVDEKQRARRVSERLMPVPDIPIIAGTCSALARALEITEDDAGPDIVIPNDITLPHLPTQFVALQIGASNATKRWPIERFRYVWESLAEAGFPCILIGGPEDRVLCEEAAASSKNPPTVFAGKLSILQTGAVLQRATLLVTNDSGPMHLAGAVGCPVVALFGPTRAERYRPYGHGHSLIQGECACAARSLESCTGKCLTSIAAEEVVQSALKSLECERTSIV
jgi:ADP-heptose:LPS heptosyltransferase